ncbi:SH3 domain-containing protein [Maribacter sp.]|uniref:SH3 domain-containing protein n=1 Tax=Maribacter sp. TaxID=1897614 RepID=UPI0025B9022F|nr:SH3 domain-containing protein [Maribacter sp.]
MRNLIYILIGLFCFSANAQLINDESYLDLDFLKFKNELLNCVIKKDTTKLKEFLAERVYESKDVCGYPGCNQTDFLKYYFKEGAEESWNDMLKILRFGFIRAVDENPERIVPHDSIIFYGPSYLKNVDSDNEVIILGENVNIREKPSLKAKVIRKASFEKFNCDCNMLTTKKTTYQTVDGINWLEIKLETGEIGYVSADLTSYELIKEMTIAKVNGEWKVISFFQEPGC